MTAVEWTLAAIAAVSVYVVGTQLWLWHYERRKRRQPLSPRQKQRAHDLQTRTFPTPAVKDEAWSP
jgi:hypothetical protein